MTDLHVNQPIISPRVKTWREMISWGTSIQAHYKISSIQKPYINSKNKMWPAAKPEWDSKKIEKGVPNCGFSREKVEFKWKLNLLLGQLHFPIVSWAHRIRWLVVDKMCKWETKSMPLFSHPPFCRNKL